MSSPASWMPTVGARSVARGASSIENPLESVVRTLMMRLNLRGLISGRGLVVPALVVAACQGAALAKGPDDYELFLELKSGGATFEEKAWVEVEASLPKPPREEDLLQIDVGPTSDNRFYVDEASVAYGSDGVIRYTMVILSPSGARNVSFEGMRCDTGERRLYAFGRRDGGWSKARNGNWARIEGGSSRNRYHAALFASYFCSSGGSVTTTDEARRVLRYGNPAASTR